MSDEIIYLTLAGIPTQEIGQTEEVYFFKDSHGTWCPSRGNYLHEIDVACVRLYSALEKHVFGSSEVYQKFFEVSPEFIFTAGMNSESKISKEMFEKLLAKLPADIPINRALYAFDCEKLISGVQECSKEVLQLQGEFYRTLNLEEMFSGQVLVSDGTRFVTSPTVTKLYALLGFVYIRLHSLLDNITKLAIELESTQTEFDIYPRLRSKGCLYRDRKKTSFDGQEGTLFEACDVINEIEAIRNHLIHDGLLDDRPKVYTVIVEGECREKYLLFPDRGPEGRLTAYKNRMLFYGREDKINLRLPSLISHFQHKLLSTLNLLLAKLEATASHAN